MRNVWYKQVNEKGNKEGMQESGFDRQPVSRHLGSRTNDVKGRCTEQTSCPIYNWVNFAPQEAWSCVQIKSLDTRALLQTVRLRRDSQKTDSPNLPSTSGKRGRRHHKEWSRERKWAMERTAFCFPAKHRISVFCSTCRRRRWALLHPRANHGKRYQMMSSAIMNEIRDLKGWHKKGSLADSRPSHQQGCMSMFFATYNIRDWFCLCISI